MKPNFVCPDPGMGSREGKYALFVGRLSPGKRVSTMLAAWGDLHLRKLNIPLVIIGGGPELEGLTKEILRRGLSHVSVRGQMTRNETVAMMHNARFSGIS